MDAKSGRQTFNQSSRIGVVTGLVWADRPVEFATAVAANAVVVDLFGRTGNTVALPQRGVRISWITLATRVEKRRYQYRGEANRTRTESKGRGRAGCGKN